MVVPFLTGSRRGRYLGIAVLLTVLVLWLGYRAPSAGVRDELFDLHTDPRPIAPGVGSPQHESTAQEAEEDQGNLSDPSTEDVDNETGKGESEPVVDVVVTTTTETTPEPTIECLDFETLQRQKPGPLSEGRRQFPYVRPPAPCRKFRLPALEKLIERMKNVIRDPDLFRLFENSYPNTLDTMVKWRGYATKKDELTGEEITTDEELTRLGHLWRGLINSHARYIIISPYCHSFQPPPESGIKPTHNAAYRHNRPRPAYDPKLVFDCKWELDSLASFLQVSAAYYTRTGDLDFFGKYSWVDAVEAAVDASAAMRLGTYDKDGRVLPSAWTFTGWTDRGSETLTNDGLGNPVKENGMVRSAFRPSDDACIFQLLTPSNMMFAAYLEQASDIMQGLAEGDVNNKAANLTVAMRELAQGIREGIALDAVVTHRDFGDIFAYEVDGYGGANLMDDANVPSLLAMPLWNYTLPAGKQMAKPANKHTPRSDATIPRAQTDNGDGDTSSETTTTTKKKETTPPQHDYARIYQNTRSFILSLSNPYFAKGPALSAVGGPHLGPGKGWPMAATVAALTAFSDLAGFASPEKRDAAVAEQLLAVLGSTAGTGVVHETVNAWEETDWTRAWFGWANGLFGELILRIAEDEEGRGLLGEEGGLLGRSWQD